MERIISIKGFNRDWTCRGFQFEIGKTYSHEGDVIACGSGFHAIEGNPLEVFSYYAPGVSRFAIVEQWGELARHGDDSKLASQYIKVVQEITLSDLVERAVKWVSDRATLEGEHATGDQGAASATGDQGAASATGYRGAASATGYQAAASATGYQAAASATGKYGAASATGKYGAASATGNYGAASATGKYGAASATGNYGAASATGNYGAASATGDQGAASATGDQGAASATGKHSVATASGYQGKALAAEGGAVFLTYRNDDYEIAHVFAGIAGRDGVKPNVWYSLGADGKIFEVEE